MYRTIVFAVFWIGAWSITGAAQGATVTAGQHTLQANQPGQWVDLRVTGGDGVPGIDLFVQIGDGGRELAEFGGGTGRPGPRITAVELLAGTIFQGVTDSPIDVGSPAIPQTAVYTLALLGNTPSVPAQGTLARLQLDTTGFYGGQWDLRLQNVLNVAALGGPYTTNFAGQPALIEDGWIRIPITGGDYNQSQSFDAADIDTLASAIRSGSTDLKFDLNQDRVVNSADHRMWVQSYAHVYFGDANLDGLFDSADLVSVFAAGQYEDAIPRNSNWARGDWSGDGEFDSSDLVFAFQDGGYERGAVTAEKAMVVPEPSGLLAAGLMVLGVQFVSRRRVDVSF